MAQDNNASTMEPPPTPEEDNATGPQSSPTAQKEDPHPTRPDSEEENNTVGPEPEPEEDNTAKIQATSEEETATTVQPPIATTRPESGEENAAEPEPVQEETAAPIQIESDEEHEAGPIQANEAGPIRLELPTGRVKRIMKLDKDINKVNSEALFLVSSSAQLFLQFLAESSGDAAAEKKRKIVKLEHIRTAAKRHRATRDFLVDELPPPSQPSDQKDRSRARAVAAAAAVPAPAGTRRIDHFFRKEAAEEAPIQNSLSHNVGKTGLSEARKEVEQVDEILLKTVGAEAKGTFAENCSGLEEIKKEEG